MARKIEELGNEILKALHIFKQLTISKFGKTKVDRYKEIAKRLSVSPNTIKTWIYKYEKSYDKYLAEIEVENNKDLKRFIAEGLTERQGEYIRLRMNGFGKEEAKIKAGYSFKTKVDSIEKTKGVSSIMLTLREKLIEDTSLGAQAVINSFVDIAKRAKEGVTVTEYIDETNPDGRLIRKTVREEKSLSAEIAAIKEIGSMLGYSVLAEKKLYSDKTKLEEELLELEKQKKKKELEEKTDTVEL